MKPSLIVSTYNSPAALRVSLDSILGQTLMPHEVIVADDGSTEETAKVVEAFARKAPVRVVHAWHPDRGFRLAAIRNLAIASATGNYIIQIDGDIVLHPRFIEDHAEAAQTGRFACGSRALLSKDLSEKVIAQGDVKRITPLSDGVFNRKNLLRLPTLSKLIARYGSKKLKYRGCNMAFWLSDLREANGYDEAYNGWGCEDHDLAARLENRGILPLPLRHRALEYHLWHPSSKVDDSFSANNERLEATRRNRITRCTDGLDKYPLPKSEARVTVYNS